MRVISRLAVGIALMAIFATSALAGEFSGSVGLEGFWYPSAALYDGQENNNGAVSARLEYYHALSDSLSMTIEPYARFDIADSERTRYYAKQANLLFVSDYYEITSGVAQVYWGATEFVHLVDIINQTDSVGSIDGEQKLGQVMFNLSVPTDAGVFDLYLLPIFKERSFAGESGRLRTQLPVSVDDAIFDARVEDRYQDVALRYSHTLGPVDFGISNFYGTSREPDINIHQTVSTIELVPYYRTINQVGIDATAVLGSAIIKLEAIRRDYDDASYVAAVGGVEYALAGVAGSAVDVGLLAEYGWDERGLDAKSISQSDVMLGVRLALNDQASSEVLAGLAHDLDYSSSIISLEASRRLGNNFRMTVESRVFMGVDEADLLYDLRDDDFVRLELGYFF